MAKGLGRSLLLLAAFFASVPLWFRTSFRTPDWTLDYVFAALSGLIGLWLLEGGEHGQASPVYRGALLLVAGIATVVLSGALAGSDPGAITWLGVTLGAVGAWQLVVGLASVRRQQQ